MTPTTGAVAATHLVTTAPTVAAPAAAADPLQSIISSVLKNVVAPTLASFLSALERGLAQSPLSWMLLAASRREVGATTAATTEATATRLAAIQTSAASVVVINEPPTAEAVFLPPNPTTGAVTGKVTGSDPEGKKVTLSLTTKPSQGTLVYNSATASFTYTPTTAQRVLAGLTAGADTIAMVVTASDGTNKVPVQIDIPISAIPITVRTDVPGGSGAGAVAATNTRAYVTNRATGTVTVIDTVTATVVGTFNVGPAPDGIAVKPDGTRLYVSSSTNNTVTVLDAATGVVKATIAVANPTSITVSPSGGSILLTNYDNGTVTRINTSTNKVALVTTLPAGSRPTGVVLSPDAKYVYVTSESAAGANSVLVFAANSTSATKIAELPGTATGLVVSPDNTKIFVSSGDGSVTVIDAKTRTVVDAIQVGGHPTSVAISRDGTALVVTDDAGRVSVYGVSTGTLLGSVTTRAASDPLSQQPSAVMSPDGTELYVTDYDAGTVHVVSLTPPNARPTAGTPTKGTPSTSTGAVTGTVGVTDPDGDPLSYNVSSPPSKGKVVVNANGTFTYTPTAAARHAASVVGANATDTFTVTVSDGRRGVVTTTVTVDVSPTNKAPTVTKTVGTPNSTNGIVTGSVKGADADKDTVTYSQATGPTKGTLTLTATGAFTYTPTTAARHAAMKPGATAADKQDAFTVAVDDGHGGVVNVSVTVTIKPVNATPTGGNGTVTQTDPRTGVVTGALTAVDGDGDTLTYTSSAPKKGTLVIGPNGTYTYTPTVAARTAASAANASAAAKAEAVTVTVVDGYGGATTFTLSLAITPYDPGNQAPADPVTTVNGSSSAIGTVTGTVSATDPDGDPITYTVTGGPTKGVVTLNSATGAFTYTPTVDARYTALVTPGVDTDSFSVTVSDGVGGTMVTTVSVTVVPPSATAVDQRPTGIAVSAPDLIFYTQAQINNAFDALLSTGITTIRILIPWAGVEAWSGVYDWSSVDRVVNTAAARGITVLGVINSTPWWAGVANTMPVSSRPADPAKYAAFAKLVATRYKGKVASYEIWNEPNGVLAWQPGPNAAQYTAILKAAYTAIKAVDPNAVVVAGALGAVVDWSGVSINPVTFLSDMYANGAAGYFDALSFHPYLYNNPFSKGAAYASSPLNQVIQMYNLMVANGDGNKKIWATEYGQPSSVVSEANQASYLGDFLRAWRNLSFAGPTFIHDLVDTTVSDPIEASFGLFHTDWTPKPVLATVEQIVAENQAIVAQSNAKVV
jgi:YVTN family beta-propeller protein/VCBS repeat-containing protein